ncbi:hypothetical protein K1T71_010621 [Dendrolimus kikuchii]|uniref:Uncharacterized protein n=1 Tax=Dendrolimus kikuchii TaxID=765133 RepID=A0ACC1CPT3_9NEOP|nr:hypothetical protein K1T71_010621 [Dendrolimus kikuchii]
MSIERRSCASPDPQVTKRLFAILVLMIGLICIFGGYLLGRMARSEAKRNHELLTYNLTTAADNLLKKARRILPKIIHQNDPDKIKSFLSRMFNCTESGCANAKSMNQFNLAEFVRTSINCHVAKLMKTVANVSLFLDTLR